MNRWYLTDDLADDLADCVLPSALLYCLPYVFNRHYSLTASIHQLGCDSK